MVREANKKDLNEILQLYLYLHEENVPGDTEHLRNTWESIVNDTNVRPYAFVENVVTHGECRKKGYATACLDFAKRIAGDICEYRSV